MAPETVTGTEVLDISSLYREFRIPIASYLMKNFRFNPEDCEDVVQDTFTNAYRHSEGFRGDCKPSTWLYGIAKNTALSHIRDTKRRHTVYECQMQRDIGSLADEASFDTNPERMLTDINTQDTMRVLADHLSTQKQRMYFELYYAEGWSAGEIAEATGNAESTVRVNIWRAVKELEGLFMDGRDGRVLH